MGIFSFGGSKSKSTSQASQFGLGVSGSRDVSTSDAFSRSRSNIAFEDIFADLYGNASAAAKLVPSINTQAEALFSGGLDFFDLLSSGGAGTEFLEGRVSGEGGVLDEQIAGLRSDLGQFFAEDINPAIREDFVRGGGLGGSRQAVETQRATESIARAFAEGSTGLRVADQAARDQAATTLAGSDASRAVAGIGGASSLFQLAQGGQVSDLAPFQALAQILGGPTVLSESDSASVARALSEAFGFDISSGQSTSSSKSKSLSFGFGPG